MGQEIIVSVVIPAYNAEMTINSTLRSVSDQTYRNLEVIVVDDGSTDGTHALAKAAAQRDCRIRVLSISNAGVAAARNAGISASHGAYIAPIDADDLWHPTKIAKQVAAMEASGPETGFVYTYYRRIGAADHVLYDSPPVRFEGRVFLPMLLMNFVGNGSSLLMRREALDQAGGYDPALQEEGAQGCEDYLLQLLIARDWQVALVPEYLTGYRMTPGAMSSVRERMARSHLLLLERIQARYPDVPGEVMAASAAQILSELAVYLLFQRRNPSASVREVISASRQSVDATLRVGSAAFKRNLTSLVKRRVLRARQAPRTGDQVFLEIDPVDRPDRYPRHPLESYLACLMRGEALDGRRQISA